MSVDTQSSFSLSEGDAPLILIVDDDIVIRGMLQKALTRQNYEVIEAANGNEAVELFHSEHPDMVLMDVMMPMMNGFDACKVMRRIDPEHTIPILILIGLDDVSSVDRAYESGATDFICKPINWSLFAQRIRYAFRTRNIDFSLRKNQRRIRHALQLAKLGYWDWDIDQDKFDIAENVLQMLGIEDAGALQLADLMAYVEEDDREKLIQAFMMAKNEGHDFALEHRLIATNGNQHFVFQQAEVIRDDAGQAHHVMGTIQDITDLKRAEELILHQAYHDILTGLPNQNLLKERLIHAIQVAETLSNQVAVIVLDIDRFQLINESLGYESGNELLIKFASFINQFVQQGDTVSRVSGNEFSILFESMHSPEMINDVIHNIRQSLHSDAFQLGSESVYISLSMGVAIYPDDGFEAEGIMQCANAAMRKAKSWGGDQECFYTSNMNRRVHDRLRMENDLRIALKNDDLELFYQPQVDVPTRKIVAVESLVRWNHAEFGLIMPVRFIPLAEETGLIRELGKYVLEKAIAQTQIWHEKGYPLRISINLSARQFMQDDLVEQVGNLLTEYKLAPKFVDLEITETIAMQDAENSIRKMNELKSLGIHLSMDDFGTGYSSLSYLNQFPLDVLKIDRSFVKDIEAHDTNGAIAKAIIAMAQSMGLEVIAEGVETEAQYEFMKQYQCNLVQGYLVSQPVPADKLENLLSEYS